MFTLIMALNWIINIYLGALIVYALCSWFPGNMTAYRLRMGLDPFFAPVLDPIRRMLASAQGGRMQIDFSPMILFLLIGLLRQLLLRALLMGSR